jgi:arabinogalactan endo-1,4-beta-galactosidase
MSCKPFLSLASLIAFACLPLPTRSESNVSIQRELLTGADISFLPYYEAQGIKYFDEGGERGFLDIAKRNGWNILRVRVWVDPSDEPKYQVSNLANVTLLGQRIKAAGF